MIDRGELEANQDERGRHLIPQRAVHAMLEERRAGVGESSTEETSRSAEEARELRERVEGLQRELGRLEGRLELTERTESTMREERERLEQLLGEERAERRRLQAEALRGMSSHTYQEPRKDLRGATLRSRTNTQGS